MTYTEAPISITVKVFGNLFTVRGDGPQNFIYNTREVTGDLGIDTVEDAVKALTAFAEQVSGIYTAEKALGATVTEVRHERVDGTPAPAAPTGQYRTDLYVWHDTDRQGNPVTWEFNRPDAPAVPDRPHLKMALKAGTNKSGKDYKGWFDPASAYQQGFPKGNEIPPMFKNVPA